MRCRTPSSVPLLAATFGLLLASSLQAADPPLPSPAQKANTTEAVVIDVALGSGGLLNGQVVGPDGKPAAGVALFVLRGTTPVATCQTDQSGGFAVPGLAGGLYEIRCQQGALACRVWASGTAPPSAQPGLLLTTGANVVRGQTAFFSRRSSWLRGPTPWIIAGVAAVAVPAALLIHHGGSSS